MAQASDAKVAAFLSLLRSASSSSSSDSDDAFQQAQQLAPSLLPSYDPSLSPLQYDQDSYSSLLSPPPIASSSKTKVGPLSGLGWLQSSLSPELAREALEILKSPSSDDDIQESLIELWGFGGIALVGEAITRRAEIVAAAAASNDDPSPPTPSNEPNYNTQPDRDPTSANGGGGGRQIPPHQFVPKAQITFLTTAEIAEAKRAKKLGRMAAKGKGRGHESDKEVDLEEWERIREASLMAGPGPLVSGRHPGLEEAIHYPHVYLSSGVAGARPVLAAGQKTVLPLGTTRDDRGEYEEVTIPAPTAVPFRFDEALMPINQMDPWGRRTFHAYETLNRLQSIVFPVAYNTNENMLVCAPTGAGKTDVALLAILRCLSSLCSTPLTNKSSPTLPPASTYKIIYIAPLKALAAEITLKFSKRLGWAGVKVRELTGDMKMTKKEVEETGVIVTTPEKWDVVTRKGAGAGDGEVAEKVKLLIIDEVHLLHEDRGAVIESIVARTLRQVESSQTPIRIVGLSATLPNYVDVADFLRVNRFQGLFYFDASFRPVPLEQHFLGVKGKAGSAQSKTGLDNAAFDKVSELLKQGHQVMVFVHARKDTVKTAQMLHEKALEEGLMELLDPMENTKWQSFKRDMGSSRNREMKELAAMGFGIHHAGMLRSDRNITERMFENNVTKVLCCTATLAWGVNLPAYAVVIKGTQIYDSGKGSFVDLSILDVLQIFGRAGRPQYESQGVGYICTSHDKLDHYVAAITQQHPIESKFVEGLVDSLNAEVSLGTVTTMDEGVRWLGYSYLFVRMRKNPLLYGMLAHDVEQDPLLGSKRHTLITNSAKRLVETQMIKFDPDLGTLVPTDLGRIASRYYIKNTSIEIFNNMFRPKMSEADVLGLIASSVEFNQINVRENEVPELTQLMENVPCQVKGGISSSAGKVNVLLQAWISKAYIDDFALVSDSGYVSQNAGRITRALLEIAMTKRWASVTLVLIAMSKAIEKRMWPFSNPLGQFDLPADLMYNIERWADDFLPNDIAVMSDAEFGSLIHQNERLGGFATRAARQMPSLSIIHEIQPITHDLLRIRLQLSRQFEWSEKYHGTVEAFWVWIEDEDNHTILQLSRVLVRQSTTTIHQEFVVPIPLELPNCLYARVVSDRWMGAEDAHLISLEKVVLPPPPPPHLPLFDLPLLSAADAFSEPLLRDLFLSETPTFDPVQTQSFHTFYHTSNNALICAPSAGSRGTLLELSIWRAFGKNSQARVLFLNPRKALARHVHLRLRNNFTPVVHSPTLLLNRSQDIDALSSHTSFIAVSAPTPLLRHLLANPNLLGTLDLIVAHDLHALDVSYELLLSRLRWTHPNTRIVGSSSSLLDATDLASWIGAPPISTYSFSPSTRTSALTTSFQSFSTPHSLSLLRSMTRPAYAAMRTTTGSTICFVPSRGQCRATASDLVTQTATDLEESFVVGSLEMIEAYSQSISDPDLAEALSHGIAVFHEGLRPEEQRLALELFGSGAVRILVASREACWTLPVRASLVLVLSAQYAIVRDDNEREIRDYALADLLQMQSLAVPPRSDVSAECLILCQKEQAEVYSRFLLQGVPVESELESDPALLPSTLWMDIVAGRIKDRQDVVDSLSWTYASRRLVTNPSYYHHSSPSASTSYIAPPSSSSFNEPNDPISRLADRLLSLLESRACILPRGVTEFAQSSLGNLFGSRGISLEEIERLQKSNLDKLVELSLGPVASKANRSGMPSAGGVMFRSKEADEALGNFHQRLPRSVKDMIGENSKKEKKKDAVVGEGEEMTAAEIGVQEDAYRRSILLAAFCAGRIPRGAGGLELEQMKLVENLLDIGSA